MFIFAPWETEYQLVFGSDGGFVLLFVLSVLTFNIHSIMTQNKKLYSQPKAELLVVRFEQDFLEGSLRFGSSGRNIDYAAGEIDDQGDF